MRAPSGCRREHGRRLPRIERLSWYGDPENYDLRADLAAYHGVDVDQVLVGAGIDDLLALVVRGFATDGGPRGDGARLLSDLAYHTATFGVPLDTAPYGADDHVDLAALAAQARASEASRARARDAGAAPHGAGVVYLANPDNPSAPGRQRSRYGISWPRCPPAASWRSTKPTSTTHPRLPPALC